MKKLLAMMCMLLVITSVAAVAVPTQNVTVNAPYLLTKLEGSSTVTMTFTMADYIAGYVEVLNVIRLQVGAPGDWSVGISATGGTSGVVDALHAKATGGGWLDVSGTSTALLTGSNGESKFYVTYQVNAAELSGTSGANISTTVLVTYAFI